MFISGRRVGRTLPLALLLLGAILTLTPPAAPASQLSQKERELGQLRQRITALRDDLARDRSAYSTMRDALQRTERRIGELAKSLHRLDGEIEAKGVRLKELKGHSMALEQSLIEQRRILSGQVRAAYLTGRQEYLKLMMNQQDPSRVGRVIAYYDYFNRARSERIAALNATLKELSEVQQTILAEREQLTTLKQQQLNERKQLDASRSERAGLVAELQQAIQSKDHQLSEMLADEEKLQSLIKALGEVLADIPADAGKQTPFAKLKGKLGWPVKGRLLARYGAPRGGGDLSWQGLLIQAKEGSEVRAVSHGRVAYADWLRGYGLLMIIDHGNGYMSLYGHNQSLFKEAGDWVGSGEVIALVGNSGGSNQNALYFEIRKEGKPTNPIRWVRR